MINTVTLRQTVSNAILASQTIKDFCTDNFGIDTVFVYAGLDIENTPNLFPMVGVRVPKLTKTSDEIEAILLIDLQILGATMPLKSGDVVETEYLDAQSGEMVSVSANTLVNYSGDEVLDGFRAVIVDEVAKATDSLCNLTLRQYQWEQDLLTTFPVYSGFIVFELYDNIYL